VRSQPITLRTTSGHHRLQLPNLTCAQPVPVACLCHGQTATGTDPLQLLAHVCGTVCLPSISSAGSLTIFKKQLKTFLFRTAYDLHVLLTFSVNSVKRLRSDLSHTPLYKLTYYIHTCIHWCNITYSVKRFWCCYSQWCQCHRRPLAIDVQGAMYIEISVYPVSVFFYLTF